MGRSEKESPIEGVTRVVARLKVSRFPEEEAISAFEWFKERQLKRVEFVMDEVGPPRRDGYPSQEGFDTKKIKCERNLYQTCT